MHKSEKSAVKLLVVYLVLFLTINLSICKRLSFKDSLTAYAENQTSSAIGTGVIKVEDKKKWKNNDDGVKISYQQRPQANTLHVGQENKIANINNDERRLNLDQIQQKPIPVSPNTQSNAVDQFSLWQKPKSFPFWFQENLSNSKTPANDHVPSASNHVALTMSPYKTRGSISNGTISNQLMKNNTKVQDGFFLDPNQQRKKKEISANPGLQELLWNTANALWSVNKEHFLPTFLHTKTGGKLSLIRDSIFKPVTILSQFKNGVQEINNEKRKNLARLSTGGTGWGWSRPIWETHTVKQTHNSRLMTLARYIFRLTKHTTITKYKLKWALLDLQIRAVKKLIRILNSKTLAQKIAVIRILSSAAWKGKKAFLQYLTEPVTTTAASPYAGKDNAVNVDITYSSLNKYNNQQAWMGYVAPPQKPTNPPSTSITPYYNSPPPTPINPYYNPQNLVPVAMNLPADAFPPQPHTMFVPPPPPNPVSFTYSPSQLSAMTRSTDSYVPPPPPTPKPLIEQPSYASVLKNMGINPTNYDFQDHVKSSTSSTSTSSSFNTISPPNPKPTVVYYSSAENTNNEVDSAKTNPTIETPTISYSIHSSSIEPLKDSTSSLTTVYDNNKVTTSYNTMIPRTTTPSTSFRMKLLEAMSVTASNGV